MQLSSVPGGPGQARYTVPADATKQLPPGTLFPMAHTSAILAAAEAGKKFLSLPLFDGTDDSGPEDSFIVVLDWKKPEPNKYAFLSNLPSTRVRLAFFDHDSTARCRPTRWGCATGRTASPTICRWTSATS